MEAYLEEGELSNEQIDHIVLTIKYYIKGVIPNEFK